MNEPAQSPPSVSAETPAHHHGFLKHVPVISACTLLSRVLGLVRDVLWARYFGAGLVSSAFLTAWNVPNLFRALFGEGAVNSAMVPTFTESLKTRTPEETQKLYSVTFTAMLLALGALTLAIELGLAALGWRGGFSEKTTLLIRYTMALLPYMPLICLAGFFMAMLNARRHFFAPAFMPAILNIVWIAAIVVFARPKAPLADAALYVSLATVFAGLLQVLFQVPFAAARGFRLRLSFDFSHPGFRQILALLVPVVVGAAAIEVNVLVDRGLAYFAVPYKGAPACLFFGNRLVQLPMAMVGLAISTAVLPALSAHAALNEMEHFRRTLSAALRSTMFLTIPASVGLMALSGPIVDVFFRHGHFDMEAALRTAWVIVCYCLGLWGQSAVFVLLRAFYALKDTKTPVRVSLSMVALNVALNLTFVWFLEEKGLALATSICGMTQFVVLSAILRRRIGPLGGEDAAGSVAKTVAASVIMGECALLAWARFWPWEHLYPGRPGTLLRLGVLAAIVVGASAVFVATAALLKMPELKQAWRVQT